MKMEVSADSRTHVILYKDKTVDYITRAEHAAVLAIRKNGADDFILRGELKNFAMVAKTMTMKEFCGSYRDMAPAAERDGFAKYGDCKGSYPGTEKALEGAIEALEEYMASDKYAGTDGPRKLAGRLRRRLASVRAEGRAGV